jgi:CPA2 family monovalent cation:H+ antiporter-2
VEYYYLKNLIIILLSSSVIVAMFRSVKASPILGYLLSGLLIGPYALGVVRDVKAVETLGEYGVVFLLFTLGLKMPLQRLQVLRRYVFGLGFVQVIVTAVIFSSIAYAFGVSTTASVLIGSALSLSSTAVSMQVLHEKGEFAQKHGRVSFAVLLSQDLAVVLILVMQISLMQSYTSLVKDLLFAVIKAFVVLVAIILLGRTVLRYIYRNVAKLDHAELFVTVTLLVVLLTSIATGYMGLSRELGAFMAGLLLSETEYRHQVEADIQPFYGLLIGFFFVSVGMHINFQFVVQNFALISSMIVLICVSKIAVIMLACKAFKISLYSSIRTAFLLATGGEFIFVIISPMMDNGIVSDYMGQMLYAITAISMSLTPFISSLGRYIVERKLQVESDHHIKSGLEEVGDLKNHIIIAGFGRVGKMVAQMLLEQMIPFVGIDNSMKAVEEARAMGFPVFFGDAKRVAVMKMLGPEKAKSVVISINNSKAALQAALMMRKNFPSLSVAVRMRDDEYVSKLYKVGAHVVVPENLEPSLQLAEKALLSIGITASEAINIIDNFRHQHQGMRSI